MYVKMVLILCTKYIINELLELLGRQVFKVKHLYCAIFIYNDIHRGSRIIPSCHHSDSQLARRVLAEYIGVSQAIREGGGLNFVGSSC